MRRVAFALFHAIRASLQTISKIFTFVGYKLAGPIVLSIYIDSAFASGMLFEIFNDVCI